MSPGVMSHHVFPPFLFYFFISVDPFKEDWKQKDSLCYGTYINQLIQKEKKKKIWDETPVLSSNEGFE